MDIDHLHSHFAFTPTDLALMMGRMEGKTVSFSAHAWDVFCQGQTLPAKLERARLCITCSRAARRRVQAIVPPELESKVRCVHHGTDLLRFSFEPSGEVGEPARILAVGRLVPKKGFEHLLYASRRLLARRRIRCRIVGTGPLEAKLRNLAQKLDLMRAIEFTGGVPPEQMPAVYEDADVLAVPSVIGPGGDRDGLPNVVLEAMARGLPVVASRLSGIPDAVSNEATGLLVRPGNNAALAEALDRMLAEEDLRERCVRNGRELVEEQFDYRKNAREVYRMIQEAAGETS
jgi:glycosyltransferase involved in cell wall biosynthesis